MSSPTTTTTTTKTPRQPIRHLLPHLHLGHFPPGPHNTLTDVPHILTSTHTLHSPLGHNPSRPQSVINTGVTTILPRADWFRTASYCAIHSFNGSGELTGSHWINETGLLNSPIVLTNSFSVGSGYEGVYRYAVREYAKKDEEGRVGLVDWFLCPVVGETYDGFLNDVAGFAVGVEDVVRGIESAGRGKVEQGNVGGGTGMLSLGFKAGTGSSSRVVPGMVRGDKREWVVGVLVQSNFGKMEDLCVGNVPVGRIWSDEGFEGGIYVGGKKKDQKGVLPERKKEGSIIVVIATDAPLHPLQLQRLAKRATVGVARTGGFGANSSGDIYIAFSTAEGPPREPETDSNMSTWKARRMARVEQSIDVVQDTTINGLFEAVVEATHEAILNAMCMAEDMEGPAGARAEAIPLDRLKDTVERYNGGR